MPSTVIRRFDYDPRTSTLGVEFISGRCYRYAGVPPGNGQGVSRGVLEGALLFNGHIRDAYPCEALEQEPAEDSWGL